MDRCPGKFAAASDGSLSGIVFFCNVQAVISQTVLISSSSTAVIGKVQFYAVQLTPTQRPWADHAGLFFPEFSGVLLRTREVLSRLRTRQCSLQRIFLS